MAVFAPYVHAPSIDRVPLYTSHEFRSPRGVLLGGDIAEGEAPSEAEAVRVARFLVER